ncbi:helix-turn-helix domain-containing protein [Prevotella falsenii]|uniref:helix-turn-helix domain-containing protein n=1 Tax=Prevotella falsenii TaxID=515414 RepID=UPI0021D069FB|nr:helix-turn-helix transcriptional regulator [Prevotella falsenii]
MLKVNEYLCHRYKNTLYMNIKKNIKAHGWTLKQLAQAMGVTQPAISALLNGNATLYKLKEIANVMGIPVAELLLEEEEQINSFKCPHCGKVIKISING